MKRKRDMAGRVCRILTMLCIPLLVLSCSQVDEILPGPGGTQDGVTVNFTFSVPSTQLPSATRASVATESLVARVDVLVMQMTGETYTYKYRVDALGLATETNGKTSFRVRIPRTDDPLKLYILANAPGTISSLSEGDSDLVVKSKVTGSFGEQGMGDYLPMSAEIILPDGLRGDRSETGVLVRSVARADVVNTADDFRMGMVMIYRAADKYSVIPGQMESNKVLRPTIPAGTLFNVTTITRTIDGSGSAGDIFIPESPLSADPLAATCIVVGAYFGGSEAMTYYRIDFRPDSDPAKLGQVLRNHRYVFRIHEVSGPGWGTPDDAANNDPTSMVVEIKEWNQSDIYMSFDGTNHFGVSSRVLKLPYQADRKQSIDVDTDVRDYRMFWSDGAGQPLPGSGTIGKGGSFTDPSGRFRADITPDGTQIVVTTLTENRTDEYFSTLLRIEAARLRVDLDIDQLNAAGTTGGRKIYVYGSNYEIGRLGDEIFMTGTNPDRPAAMIRKLKNTALFGPGGQVDFGGFMFGGAHSYNISPLVVSQFDVIYLTYGGQPTIDTYNALSDGLATDPNKVVVIQYDNHATNRVVMQAFGVTHTQRADVRQFTLYSGALAEITDGPFGELPPTFQMRCNDTTHGEIELQHALDNNITPILLGGEFGGVVLGIDFDRRIVYSGDIDLYYSHAGNPGIYPSNGNTIENDADVLIMNLWAWIARTVLD